MIGIARLAAVLLALLGLGAGPGGAAGPWPASVTAACGDLTVRIDGPKMWTLSRIEYRGTRLGIEESAYGTVFNFPEVGFVGTGHRDGGVEQVHSVEFYLDGRRVDAPGPVLRGRSFRVEKRSHIRDLGLESVVSVESGRIHERTVIRADHAVPLRFGYHFMHAWTPTATAYLAGTDAGEELGGDLLDAPEFERQFYINREMDWMAVYDGPSGNAIVSRLLERPARGGAAIKLRNCPRVNRTIYLQAFVDQTVPAGFEGTYAMVTGFFSAPAQEWRARARALAAELRPKSGKGR
jgi:hypothetical protein